MVAIGIEALELGDVVLPEWHPHAADGTCLIQGFLIRHPDGLILVDTGVGVGNSFIDEVYHPNVVPIVEALHGAGVDERDVVAIVNTHLHFDHCGQNSLLPKANVHVQRAEMQAAAAEFYTVPEWAAIEPDRLRLLDGDEEIAPSVTILHTPGHTPGHQSVLVGDELIVGQACYTCSQFEGATIIDADIHDPTWRTTADASLERLHTLSPRTAHFSHDAAVYRRQSGS